ncbi:hypothetical protein B296_00037854 [Ensete ventricosum]|uniref:Uncharacterized protein n=1 Tax=Ensete ventricosum TaxID=4639 RepID=A0A426X7Z9_ENSVE|nr:hypothetical protein B296_00037854 [Ensete ventricosum]
MSSPLHLRRRWESPLYGLAVGGRCPYGLAVGNRPLRPRRERAAPCGLAAGDHPCGCRTTSGHARKCLLPTWAAYENVARTRREENTRWWLKL